MPWSGYQKFKILLINSQSLRNKVTLKFKVMVAARVRVSTGRRGIEALYPWMSKLVFWGILTPLGALLGVCKFILKY